MIRQAILLLTLAAMPAISQASCADNPMECTMDSSMQIGSFELTAAEVLQAITAARLTALESLKAGIITAQHAAYVQAHADRARALYDQAKKLCSAGPDGNCRTNARQASNLLDEAREALP